MAWLDCQKVFDTVPHSWMIKSLELNGINYKIISLHNKIMSYWRTSVRLYTEQ
jgi:hypothetical protein